MTSSSCPICEEARAKLDAALGRVAKLEAETEVLRAQLREVLKHDELQTADLERYRNLYERNRPNCPERVAQDELQLAFEEVLSTYGAAPAANDAAPDDAQQASSAPASDTPPPSGGTGPKGDPPKRGKPHGRRRLDLSSLPVEQIEIVPDEVKASGGKGFIRIGEETADRIAFRAAQYVRLRTVRGKYVREDDAADVGDDQQAVLVAPLPPGLWPGVMADPSAITQVIIAKYDDVTPLARQERISDRHGFALPRSTQCGWLSAAYDVLYRIVEAMFEEARRTAFCIATDATGARVRASGCCDNWHVFVLIADRDHVVFRFAREHTSATVAALLEGFRGHLLSDAAPVYDILHRSGDVIEVACWFHTRRYFWRALETDRGPAMEAMAIISQLFKVDAACREIPMPARTEARANKARPLLEMFDRWCDAHRGRADPRGPLDKAIGYYDNQRDALHRFLQDGRLRLDNNISEGHLRNLILGEHNWQWFASETGLRWYTTFRSLIASCALHGLNAQVYLEQVLRLAPHWPVTRMLELSPKYWAQTVNALDARTRSILDRPWEHAPGDAPVAAETEAAA